MTDKTIRLRTLAEVEELLKYHACTYYERQNGIRANGNISYLVDAENIKLICTEKSDGSRTLVIVFRVGKASDFWFMWNILDDQAQALIEELARHYFEINEYNEKKKGNE